MNFRLVLMKICPKIRVSGISRCSCTQARFKVILNNFIVSLLLVLSRIFTSIRMRNRSRNLKMISTSFCLRFVSTVVVLFYIDYLHAVARTMVGNRGVIEKKNVAQKNKPDKERMVSQNSVRPVLLLRSRPLMQIYILNDQHTLTLRRPFLEWL